ncbi:putative transposition, RNA-mediated [Lyophyllum shimeji]|uniref:Transposition, RNA-mediated n=1 Tax=Lyophyllum shimeji TaxID=47721 RepID=A0A9P3PV35_LYOSH|nr:putative transposition, RNA-mediated [Lyophyllum shimeji]
MLDQYLHPVVTQDVQELNKVTVRDAGLPPRLDDFAEGFVGRVIYGLADLFAGYDGRRMAIKSRPMTTFSCMIGPLRSCALPQGATNSVPEFQRCSTHAIVEEIPNNGNVFIDDVGIMGPADWYDQREVAPQIRQAVYEYATVLDRFLVRFITAGITASGKKMVLATPKLNIVGTIVSHEGWHLEHGLASKIVKWPRPTSVTDVRSFLGTAGVGRKWIKNFALIAKPLTLLTRMTDSEFFFDDGAVDAMEALKDRVSAAPVLVKIDYTTAKRHSRIDVLPRASDDGLVVVAVDSCTNGAGWILQQISNREKRPALFGSVTFNEVESRYSQPKCELYGVFRAVKDLRHRIWGIHFRIDADAKFLTEMIKNPDLPNAPMTRWVSYLSLFDFTINHVPALSHKAADGLSRRKRSPDDSDDEDAEKYLDSFVNKSTYVRASLSVFINSVSIRALNRGASPIVDNKFFSNLLIELRQMPPTPYGSYSTRSIVEDLPVFGSSPSRRIEQYDGMNFDPSGIEQGNEIQGSLLRRSLLRTVDTFGYIGREFEHRRVQDPELVECSLGGEVFSLELITYRRAYISELREGEPVPTTTFQLSANRRIGDPLTRTDNRTGYHDVPADATVTCATHTFGKKDFESPELWAEIYKYLSEDVIPESYDTAEKRRKFVGKTKQFFVHDARLWKHEKGGRPPRLVVTDIPRRQELIAQAHNEAGHRGRDGTYKTLAEHFYWPNLYDDVAYFVRSCNICQLRSKARPIIAFSPTWSTAILRVFCLDTIHMETGYGGKNYILQGIEPSIGWPEARAAAKNDSETWARFMYEDIICRFGHIPVFIVDGGKEFLGAADILYKQYGITVIISSPYHPQGNGIAERGHQTLVNSIMRACGKDSNKWPLYLHAGLCAMRITTSRVTGYPPYYLLYGRYPFFAFDMADRTWDTLDWDTVRTTEELIAIRIQQLLRRDRKLVLALEHQKAARQRAVDDFNRTHAKYLSSGLFELGTWVLLHETWLDTQIGNKGALRWSGPYIVHKQLKDTTYQLRELDGTVRRESVAANRLKIFYYRDDHQTVRTVDAAVYQVFAAASRSRSTNASDILHRINNDNRLAIPPYGLAVAPGRVLETTNVRLEYVRPYAMGLSSTGYPSISDLITVRNPQLHYLNIKSLIRQALEDLPLR